MNFSREVKSNYILEKILCPKATLFEAEEMKSQLTEDLKSFPQNLVLDFDRCYYIDSVFLGNIIMILKQMNSYGGKIYFANVHSEIYNILVNTGIDKIIKLIYERELNNL